MECLSERLRIPELTALCKKYAVIRLSVFGSALRDDFSEASDIDFVVEFGQTEQFSASKQYFGFAHELEVLYGRPVDLVERNGIKNPYFKESVEEQEVSVYAA
jgi:hypothetical protein